MTVLDTRREVLQTRAAQGASAAVVAELTKLLDREAAIIANEFTNEKSKRELETARLECAQVIAQILPVLNADVDTWAEREQRKADAEPRRTNRKSAAEMVAIGAMLDRADDPAEIEALVNDVAANGDALALKAAWSSASKKLRELAAKEQRQHRINGRAFFLLTTLEARVGKILRAELPSERSHDIAEESKRRKASARRQALECCQVLGLDALVKRCELQLQTPTAATTVMGSFWEGLEVKRRAR
jgi:hypothetical protein